MATVNGHAPRRRFGQNFLVDAGLIETIANLVAPAAGEQIVEIGPGLGALTDALLARVPHLTVIEIDRDLAARLRRRIAPDALTLIEADALRVDWSTLGDAGRPLRLVGNLPYNISSPLLVALIGARHRVRDQHFMLQREVVDRIVAGPGPQCGRLGLLLQAFYRCERVLEVPPEAFDPAPRVQSALVRMRVLDRAQVADARVLGELLGVAFSRRRKMIRATLLPWLAARGIHEPGIDGTLRPEQVPATFWHDVADRLAQQRQGEREVRREDPIESGVRSACAGEDAVAPKLPLSSSSHPQPSTGETP